MLNPEFLNKNCYRKYPLRATSSYTTQEGVQLPLSLLAGLRISTKLSVSDLYISKIFINNNYINITVTCKSTPDITVGYFAGNVVQIFQTLKLTPIQTYASGTIVIGDNTILKDLQGTHTLEYQNGKIEDSLIFCYSPPGLHSISNNDRIATGLITLELDNVKKSTPFVFGVIDVTTVLSNSDNTSTHLNCPTNIILGINSVEPDNSSNIDVYAIAPLTITIVPGGIKINTPTLTSKDICTNVNVNIPPLLEENHYKGYLALNDPERNILITKIPEFRDLWEQYQ
jgi:hypothetical protein